MTTSHLKRKRQGWYARLVVPPHLRSIVGKRELLRTLNTRDLAEANKRKHAVLADLQRMLSSAAVQPQLAKDSAAYILDIAKGQRGALRAGELSDMEAEAGLDAAVQSHLDVLRRKYGTDPETGDPLAPEDHAEAVQLSYRVLEHGELLSDQMEMYLGEVSSGVRQQTVQDKSRAFKEFKDWLKRDVEVRTVTKVVAGRYVSEILAKKGWAPKTIKTNLSHLSALWTWLEGRGLAESNPWLRMSTTLTVSKRGREATRRGWTDEELCTLLQKLPPSDPLFSITALAVYTGMRREEVCQLKASDVVDGALTGC